MVYCNRRGAPLFLCFRIFHRVYLSSLLFLLRYTPPYSPHIYLDVLPFSFFGIAEPLSFCFFFLICHVHIERVLLLFHDSEYGYRFCCTLYIFLDVHCPFWDVYNIHLMVFLHHNIYILAFLPYYLSKTELNPSVRPAVHLPYHAP